MIGLEYVLNLYNMQHQELAEKLGIRKQNINLWIKGKQGVSKKHLPKLSEIFNLPEEYFQKELTELDKIIIQKVKLQKDIKPKIKKYETRLILSDNYKKTDLEDIPIYEQKELNEIEIEIRKVKAIEEFREAISYINSDYEITTIEQIVILLKNNFKEKIFIDTIDAVSHYFGVLPDWVGDPYNDEFVEKFSNIAEKHQKGEIN
ncbi:helix-turn-helix domain-containing protein [Clostridium botulinum]|uniref:helix-turn-helix domain-containing protein n=1 Tax=Clostridium botulinum TaxID=1491 RepID=UPI0007734467|nr:helix-turn-helix transcriptional regulator [Clostridium botulinum]